MKHNITPISMAPSITSNGLKFNVHVNILYDNLSNKFINVIFLNEIVSIK